MTTATEVDPAVNKRPALIITTIASFLTPFGISSVNIALPSIGKTFSLDAILLGWVTTVYLLPSAMFMVPCGKIADIYGRKRMFTYGILTFIIGSAGSALSNSAPMLIGFRILQGLGASSVYPVGTAILTSTYSARELGKVLGINGAAVYLGFSSGPFFGGLLTQHLGWRSIFFANVLLGFVVILLILWKLRGEWREAEEEKFDLTGSVLYSIILFFILYGFSQLSTLQGAGLVLAGLVVALLFIKWETKVRTPVLEIKLFRNNRTFAFTNLATLIHSSASFAITFLLSLYLQYMKKLTPENAGLILIAQPVVQALCSPFSGRLSDRVEPRIVASIGLALTGLGIGLLIALNETTTLAFILGTLILLGFGYGLFSVPNANAVMSSVESRLYGVASGTLSTMRITGMAFSMGIAVLIFSIYLGKVQITPETYPVFLRCIRLAFAFFTLLCFGGIFASLARGNIR
ncbi:MAG TPA: MFS transporter [Thermodesulfobacteriota bacterium]|nr:MFS transporter [Thermodesulfobacteriota bacterium]